ncbi:hypothetical protein OE88DRAFT_1715445 [Heliocybe sulcata]|uniref:Uncharacterized protein n=1 Tax=Heliocybe sulcata TaxID=5364 RepID=A0A5C3MLS1_9AGAM|nr:hypothetical protein OE88DRAFT_1715445 [Heliocybe sulcata]
MIQYKIALTVVGVIPGGTNLGVPKKLESNLNTFTPILTYLLRSNSDVTSLLLGTALKAIVAYVTDYITKTPLKTYTIFQTIRDVFDRQSTMIGGTLDDQEKARKLLTQIVNLLTVKMEIGAPMASAYLLGNPDHYTSHRFKTVYWKAYVNEVLTDWDLLDQNEVPSDIKSEENTDEPKHRVLIKRTADGYIMYSVVMDYIYRPDIYETISLYDWICLARKTPITRKTSISSQADTKLNDPHDQLGTSSTEEQDRQKEPVGYNFTIHHPQHNTHNVIMVKEMRALVPNFIGGNLPRKDSGNPLEKR